MDKEYCEDCESFYVYLATLAPPGKQFTPTCTIALKSGGKFTPISEIEICTMKNKTTGEVIEMEREILYGIKPAENHWEYVCMKCNGKGYLESCENIKKCYYCHGTGEVEVIVKWEEEFERERDKRGFYKFWVEANLNKYIGYGKVKIKVRKGYIQIERIN